MLLAMRPGPIFAGRQKREPGDLFSVAPFGTDSWLSVAPFGTDSWRGSYRPGGGQFSLIFLNSYCPALF